MVMGADRVGADNVRADNVEADKVEADKVEADKVEADKVEVDNVVPDSNFVLEVNNIKEFSDPLVGFANSFSEPNQGNLC